MEAKFRGKAHQLYGPVVSDLKAVGKKSLEWDLNDWKWDGDLFRATPLNSIPSDCRSRQLFPVGQEIPEIAGLSNSSSSGSDDINLVNDGGKRESEKRRRVVAVEGEDQLNDEGAPLNLKLGGQVYPIMEGELKSGKKTKIVGMTSNRAVCQVENCMADLSNAKDYHRRHKVCEMHSKATNALVGNVLQRFCQQCSRFHFLQEFDEGKRSCRRRLAGHNSRRRKTHPDTVVNGGSLNDEKGSSYLLISLLRILSNMHSNNSDQTKDQDLLSHLLRNLASLAGTVDGRNISALLEGSQGLLNAGTSNGASQKVPDVTPNGPEPSRPVSSASKRDDCINLHEHPRPMGQCMTASASDLAQKRISSDDSEGGHLKTLSGVQYTNLPPSKDGLPSKSITSVKLNNIDLNNVCDDSEDNVENLGRSHAPVNSGTGFLGHPLWVQQDPHKSSPPQTSGNSGSTSSQSPSSSSGEAQIRTDRIVFKLFGKDPNDFPLNLRTQILDWLSHSPTEIESYIRPGCIILTMYLRLEKSAWEELCCDLGSYMQRLLDESIDPFWRTGWVYTRVRHCVAFMYNGQVVLDTPLPLKSHKSCRISSIKPIAVSVSERVQFVVKVFNLSRSSARLLCAQEGKYLVQETCYDLMDSADTATEHGELQCLSFPCSIPNVTGRGFIEVEDHCLSSSFFPFIVAEQEVCSEICMLEGAIEVAETADDTQRVPELLEAKTQAMDFLHEMGWLLHRSNAKFRLSHLDPNQDLFPFKRFKWLMEFSMDHDWCAVVKKLLNILFERVVDAGDHPSVVLALLDLSLLHRAVRRNCRPMVELLLRFVPDKVLDKRGTFIISLRSKAKETMAHHMFFLSFLVALAAIEGIQAVDYEVTNTAGNTPGGVRFNNDIGSEYSKQTLVSATDFIWRLFQQNSDADRKNLQKVSLFIDDMDGIAGTRNDEIHVSARYINNYSGDVKREITGVLYHEMTHVWQWNGNGQAPGELIEGIADFVRLKADYAPSHWVQPGQGDKWDQGSDVTARFLDYCNSLKNGFVAELNNKMRSGYDANYFVELLGKSIDQLWSDYKAKYGN